jgi:hypothetical protein
LIVLPSLLLRSSVKFFCKDGWQPVPHRQIGFLYMTLFHLGGWWVHIGGCQVSFGYTWTHTINILQMMAILTTVPTPR